MSESKSNRGVVAMAALGGAALLLAGVARSSAAEYPITVSHTDGNTGSGVYSSDGYHGSTSGNTWPAAGHTAGQDDGAGNFSGGLVYRYIMIFKLPVLPTGEGVQTATMDVNFNAKDGTPTGDAQLFYFPTTSHGTVWYNDFERAGTQVTSDADPLLTPTSAMGHYLVDVTPFIQASYTNGLAYAMFRIGIPTDHDTSSPTADRYRFGNSKLTLVTALVPEPAGLSLLGFVGLAMLRRRKGA